jgi:hypothetical protein
LRGRKEGEIGERRSWKREVGSGEVEKIGEGVEGSERNEWEGRIESRERKIG